MVLTSPSPRPLRLSQLEVKASKGDHGETWDAGIEHEEASTTVFH